MKAHFLQGTYYCLLSILLTAILSACGFHLKGNTPDNHTLTSLYIKGENRFDDIAAEVRQLAKSYGIKSDSNAEWSISLSNEDLSKWQASTNQSVSTREYNIHLSVTLTIYHCGEPLKPIMLATEALFQDNIDQLASKENEKAVIISELRKEIASSILRQVTFISNNPPDCQHSHEAETATTKQ